MKTKFFLSALMSVVFISFVTAQNRTRINTINSEISDNLDLRAVASIFGDSRNLQDFERRLNDPRIQISNLDLNEDNQVDYLRVIETVKRGTHVIILQSVIDFDLYQDIATIEVEKDKLNQVNIQIVGNQFIYGHNYIFEPVYYSTPRIYASFWLRNYRPYCSNWGWNFYPSYYYSWNPFPVYRYRNNINVCLNNSNYYNYVNCRRSTLAINIYNSRRANGYEKLHPNLSFSRRNNEFSNRYELDQNRNNRIVENRLEPSKSTSTSTRLEENFRNSSQNRTDLLRATNPQRNEHVRNNSDRNIELPRTTSSNRTETNGDFSRNRNQEQKSPPARFSQSETRNFNPRNGNRRT